MITPATYAALLRVALLVAGVGRLAYTAHDGRRLDVTLADCAFSLQWQQPAPTATDGFTCEWKGCGDLVRDLAMAGGLLVVGSVPLKRPEDEND